jgi:hypothetical protein
MRLLTQTPPTVAPVRHAGPMNGGDDLDESDETPELADVIDELRSLLRAFDNVEPAVMDERFYIHAYNELDLAGRTIIDAFDRERGSHQGRCD